MQEWAGSPVTWVGSWNLIYMLLKIKVKDEQTIFDVKMIN